MNRRAFFRGLFAAGIVAAAGHFAPVAFAPSGDAFIRGIREAVRDARLLDVPLSRNEAGAPRIWSIGSRVRVPTHVLWRQP